MYTKRWVSATKIIDWAVIIVVAATLPAALLLISLIVPELQGIVIQSIELSDQVAASGGWGRLAGMFGIFFAFLLLGSVIIFMILQSLAAADVSFILSTLGEIPEGEAPNLVRKLRVEYNIWHVSVSFGLVSGSEERDMSPKQPSTQQRSPNACSKYSCSSYIARTKDWSNASLTCLSIAACFLLVGFGLLTAALLNAPEQIPDEQTGEQIVRSLTKAEFYLLTGFLEGAWFTLIAPVCGIIVIVLGTYIQRSK